MDKGVVFKFNIETNGTRKPKIVGETNLPDGTELWVSIEGKSVRYNGQGKAIVQTGRFQSETFSSNYDDLETGQYIAGAGMPIPGVQPPAVRAVIGEKGEHLKGSLVKQEGVLGVTISVEQPFELKSDGTITLAVNKSEIVAAEKNALEVFNALKRLEQQGRSMESLRSNKIPENLRQCGDLMRERQKIADDLRAKAEALPQPFATYLTPAAIELKLCVSCASFAMDNCDRAKTSLAQAEKDMRKK